MLVDENDGEYVGWLGDDVGVTEDPRVGQTGKDPVVVEISEDGKHLDVAPVQVEDEDMLMRGAGLVRCGQPASSTALRLLTLRWVSSPVAGSCISGTHWPPVHYLGSIGADEAMPRLLVDMVTGSNGK